MKWKRKKSTRDKFYKVSEVIKMIILGSLCGLKNVRQIHQWAVSDKVSEFLREKFGIERVPCYYWMLCPLKIVRACLVFAKDIERQYNKGKKKEG